MKYVANVGVFVVLYIVFMLPTYLLPYFGSNSMVVAGAAAAADKGINPASFFHLGALLLLIALAWLRGSYIDKKWLVIFPILATVFDLVPVLNFIPLVPTIMHICVIILGVAGAKVSSSGLNT